MASEDEARLKLIQDKIKKYDPYIQKAFELLKDVNKFSLIHALEHCGIPKDVKVTLVKNDDIWMKASESGAKLWLIATKGNLRLTQGTWYQATGPISSDSRIYKDADTLSHSIMLAFDYKVPLAVLRTLFLNAKKIQPIIHTLYGYEPCNLLDMSKEEYRQEKLLNDAKIIEYSEKYKDHINFLVSKSPYQAANCLLALQGRINLKIQTTLQEVLINGNTLTLDSLVVHSFEVLAEATRELIAKYQLPETSEEDKIKIKQYLALYFAQIEDINTKANTYIDSIRRKYNLSDTDAA